MDLPNKPSLRINIIHEPSVSEPYAVILKPRGLPSAPLAEGENSAYAQAQNLFPMLKEVRGIKECEHGLLHRIDTETEGLLLIASTQEFYGYMRGIQEKGLFVKHYTACCAENTCVDESYAPLPRDLRQRLDAWQKEPPGKSLSFEVESRFRSYGLKNREVRPVTESAGRAAQKKAGSAAYKTKVLLQKEAAGRVKAECTLSKGFRHQVRCHLAWCGLAIEGDALYNAAAKSAACQGAMQFRAHKIEFPYNGNQKSYSL